MRAVSVSASRMRSLYAVPHFVLLTDVERSPEKTVEVPIDDDFAGKEVVARSLNPQTYRPEWVWLIIFQAGEVQNPLCTVLQTHKNELRE